MDFGNQEVTEGVYAAYANAVQTAGNLVGVFVEFTAGVKHREHNLKGAPVLFFVHAGGDATAVVLYAD